jgi:hypothetical protein
MSPMGYAMLVATAAAPPDPASTIGWKTSALTSAAAASPTIAPSSQALRGMS